MTLSSRQETENTLKIFGIIPLFSFKKVTTGIIENGVTTVNYYVTPQHYKEEFALNDNNRERNQNTPNQ